MLSQRIEGEKIRCIGGKISKPRLIHQSGGHRAIFVDVRSARAKVVRVWRVVKS